VIQSPAAVLATLSFICAFFFWLQRRTGWAIFETFPPLLWIYAVPTLLNNVGVLPTRSSAYDVLADGVLPAFLVLMLISVDLRAALQTMGRGVAVMLCGSLGVVLGAVVSFAIAKPFLSEGSWKLFGALSGAWIGGTGNMAAVAGGMGLEPSDLGVAILADNVVYVVWLPILLSSKRVAARFNRWAKVDPERLRKMERAGAEASGDTRVDLHHVLYLVAIVTSVVFLSNALAERLPELPPVLSTSTWRTLIITTLSLALSFTPARDLPASRSIGLAFVYLFLAGMGARANIGNLGDAPVFLAASFLWIAIHGLACLGAAKVLRVDLHTAAIASAANVGGAASAPVVAAHHRDTLVPASILMALVGYAAGNYLAVLTAQLCFWVAS